MPNVFCCDSFAGRDKGFMCPLALSQTPIKKKEGVTTLAARCRAADVTALKYDHV